MSELEVEAIRSIGTLDAADWNRLAGAENPFVRHAFLKALEDSDSVGAATGWDKYAAVNPIVCDNYFHNDFGAGFCKKGWLNTLTVLGFLNYLAAFVTGFAALMHYVAARNNNGKVLP